MSFLPEGYPSRSWSLPSVSATGASDATVLHGGVRAGMTCTSTALTVTPAGCVGSTHAKLVDVNEPPGTMWMYGTASTRTSVTATVRLCVASTAVSGCPNASLPSCTDTVTA